MVWMNPNHIASEEKTNPTRDECGADVRQS